MADDIDTEGYGPFKYAAEHWPEIKFWFWTGLFVGASLVMIVMTTIMTEGVKGSSALVALLGTIAATLMAMAIVTVFFGRMERKRRTAANAQEIANKIQTALERINRALLAEWTPDAIAAHIGVSLDGMALFAADKDSGKPVLYVEIVLRSLARVPCDVIITTGTCRLCTLPVPGQEIVTLSFPKVDVSFDGSLRPGSITMRRELRLVIPETAVNTLRTLSVPAIWILVECAVSYRVDGQLFVASTGSLIQRALTLPSEWVKP